MILSQFVRRTRVIFTSNDKVSIDQFYKKKYGFALYVRHTYGRVTPILLHTGDELEESNKLASIIYTEEEISDSIFRDCSVTNFEIELIDTYDPESLIKQIVKIKIFIDYDEYLKKREIIVRAACRDLNIENQVANKVVNLKLA